jgi:hypothetical protein
MKKPTRKNLIEIINKQFEIAGYNVTFEEVALKYKDNNWLYDYPTTQEKEDEFRDWLKVYLKQYSLKGRLERDVQWFMLQY